MKNKKNMLWYDRKRIWCGLPWTFVQYGQSEDRLFIERGFFNKLEDEVRLYRIMNITLTKTFLQRVFGLGTIHVDSTDKAMKSFDIVNIRHCEARKEILSETVEKERIRNRVSAREFMVNGDADNEHEYNDTVDSDIDDSDTDDHDMDDDDSDDNTN